MSNEELAQEQEYVSMLYGRLDSNRERASARLATVMRENGGTHQARSERESLTVMYFRQLAQFDAAENGLCFGRLDFDDGQPRYIGRIGLRDESDDYDPLLMDWRAPAARPFYLATAASSDGVRRRRHIKTRNRTVTGLDDEVLDLASRRSAPASGPHRRSRAARRGQRQPDRPDERHRGDHPGRAGSHHQVRPARRARCARRPGHREDRRRLAPGRIPSVYAPRAAIQARAY